MDTVVLDKTGTLTFGRPEVQRVAPDPGIAENELLDAAATAELRSKHPLGKAIVAYTRELGREVAEPASFAYTPGRGIATKAGKDTILVGNRTWMADNGVDASAAGSSDAAGSEVLVARNGHLLGAIVVADTIRPEAKRAIDTLRQMGLRTVLLTGDARRVAMSVGTALGIVTFETELLPEDKLTHIKALVAAKRVVAMVGDGVNDAPALAECGRCHGIRHRRRAGER